MRAAKPLPVVLAFFWGLAGCVSSEVSSPQIASRASGDFPTYSTPLVGFNLLNLLLDSNCGAVADDVFKGALADQLRSRSNGLVTGASSAPVSLLVAVGLECSTDAYDENDEITEVVAAMTGVSMLPIPDSMQYISTFSAALNGRTILEDSTTGINSGTRSGFYIGSFAALADLYRKMAENAAGNIASDILWKLNSIDAISENANLSDEERLRRAIEFLKSACVLSGRSAEITINRELITVEQSSERLVSEISVVKTSEREGFEYISSEFLAQQSSEIRECMQPRIDQILSAML